MLGGVAAGGRRGGRRRVGVRRGRRRARARSATWGSARGGGRGRGRRCRRAGCCGGEVGVAGRARRGGDRGRDRGAGGRARSAGPGCSTAGRHRAAGRARSGRCAGRGSVVVPGAVLRRYRARAVRLPAGVRRRSACRRRRSARPAARSPDRCWRPGSSRRRSRRRRRGRCCRSVVMVPLLPEAMSTADPGAPEETACTSPSAPPPAASTAAIGTAARNAGRRGPRCRPPELPRSKGRRSSSSPPPPPPYPPLTAGAGPEAVAGMSAVSLGGRRIRSRPVARSDRRVTSALRSLGAGYSALGGRAQPLGLDGGGPEPGCAGRG